jgi:beta-hydroxyacyl-ACP dehydratase FabZ
MSVVDIEGIVNCLPHRYPFLLLDRVVEMEPKKSVVAIKNVTFNEWFFQGHFPGAPVMPGVLIIEAMAQAGAVLILHEMTDREGKLVYFTGIDGARFRRPVRPGDQLRFTLEVLKLRSRTCRMKGIAEVDGELAAEAEIFSILVDRE